MFGFGPSFTEHEKQLIRQMRLLRQALGVPAHQAKAEAENECLEAIAASKKAGYYGAGPLGRAVLQKVYAPDTAVTLAALRREGVSDEDIIEWWDLDDVDRQMIRSRNGRNCMSLYAKLLAEGLTKEEAGRRVWKTFPIYGDCMIAPTFLDDSTSIPLPEELCLRVDRWGEAVREKNALNLVQEELRAFATMNGYIRSLIHRNLL